MRVTLLANPDNLHVRRWIEFLAGRGHTLTLVTDPFTHHRPAGCEILIPRWNLLTNILAFKLTPRPFGNDRWKHLHYRPLVRASRPDVVHGFEAFNYGLATALAGPFPRVLSCWGKDVHQVPDTSPLAGRMVTRALHGVDIISANDESMPEYLERRFGIARARVRAFSWGVDLEVFRPGLREAAQRWRHELQIPPDAPVILSPRNFDPYWGSDLLMGAIPDVLRAWPAAVFVIVRGLGGKAELFDTARRRAESEGLAASVRFLDRPLAEPEMAGLFNLAQAFISIPRTDLLAQTILEGMACGALPILGDQPAYRKHARAGENSLILNDFSVPELTAAINEALRDTTLREAAQTENPRRMTEQENWHINALKMEDVYTVAIEHYNTFNHESHE